MAFSVRWLGAALIGAALASAAQAQAQTAPASGTPTLHARAKHHHRRHVAEPEGRQITVHKSAQRATPSWLTLGNDASVGTGNNYVTSTFDQPSPVEGTFQGYRGRGRIYPQFDVPGVPQFKLF